MLINIRNIQRFESDIYVAFSHLKMYEWRQYYLKLVEYLPNLEKIGWACKLNFFQSRQVLN